MLRFRNLHTAALPGFFLDEGEKTRSHLKGVKPMEGARGRPSWMITKFKFIKRFKVLENETVFEESQRFLAKNPIVQRKIPKDF